MSEFDVILEECVDLLASGESSLEECLIAYPEYAAQLEPILCTATRLREAREVTPPPFLRARIRGELQQASKSAPQKKSRFYGFFLAKGIESIPHDSYRNRDKYDSLTGSFAGGTPLQIETNQRESLAGNDS